MKIVGIIPARYASSRFPGKPLASIMGKPMIQWVYEKVSALDELADVFVATDDERIADAVAAFNGKFVMTGECRCGSERVFEVAKNIDCDVVLNIQGDEPLIRVEMIRKLIGAFSDPTVQMATLKKQINDIQSITNPNIAKIITDSRGDAIYFSRSTIPFDRDNSKSLPYYKHIGIYGYTKEFLRTFVSLPQSPLEIMEQLEQLRVIDNGYKIRVIESEYDSIGVDLPEHIAMIEERMRGEMNE